MDSIAGGVKPLVTAAAFGLLIVGAAIFALSRGGDAQSAGTFEVTMVDSPDPVAPGGVVTYTITVKNVGATQAFADFEDSVTGLALIQSATPSQGSCATLSAVTLTCALGLLAPNATATITVEKLTAGGGVGGIVEVGVGGALGLVEDGSESAAQPNGGSGPWIPYAVVAGGAAAGLAVAAGGWYARRRWLR